jgi:hypothetical protein
MGGPIQDETIVRPTADSPKGLRSPADVSDAPSSGIERPKRQPSNGAETQEFPASGGPDAQSAGRARVFGLAFVAVLALACCLPFAHAVYWLGDEGILLRGAGEMLAGRKLYTEIFEFYPPGGLLITEGWLFLFGQSFAAARALAITSIVGTACFAYLACVVASRRVVLPAALVGVWLVMSQGQWTMVDHHWFTTSFSMLAAWLSLAGVTEAKPGLRSSFIAGLASGAAVMVTPTRGALAALAALGSLVDLRDRKTVVAMCIAGCAIVPLACLAYIILNGELAAGYADIIGFPATNYVGIQKVSFAAGVTGPFIPLALLFPLAAILPLVVVLRYGRGVLKERLFRACLLFAAAGFVGLYPRPDLVHISFAAPLALPLVAYCATRITWKWDSRLVAAAGVAALALCLPGSLSFAQAAREALRAPISPTAAGPISFIGDPDAPAAFAMIDKTSNADGFLFYPYMPLASFIAQREQISKYDVFLPGYTPPNQYAEACATANARATWLVLDRIGMSVARYKSTFPAMRNPRPPETAAFERSIEDDFRFVARVGRYEIRKRVTPPPIRACGA